MADLTYDSGALSTLAGQLSTITSNLTDDNGLKHYNSEDVATDEVAEAIDDFVNDWDDKRKKLNNKVEALATMAGESSKKFSEADIELANSLQAETTTR